MSPAFNQPQCRLSHYLVILHVSLLRKICGFLLNDFLLVFVDFVLGNLGYRKQLFGIYTLGLSLQLKLFSTWFIVKKLFSAVFYLLCRYVSYNTVLSTHESLSPASHHKPVDSDVDNNRFKISIYMPHSHKKRNHSRKSVRKDPTQNHCIYLTTTKCIKRLGFSH